MTKHIPNFLTLCNLMCGMAALFFAFYFYSHPQYALWAIAAAAVFDFLDGMAARLLKAYSEIGKQLDSLSDMVSFGAAPAALLAISIMQHAPDVWWVGLLGALLAPAAALRLAKFNIDTRQSEEFRGLAVPAMALFIASFCAAYLTPLTIMGIHPAYSLVLAALLITLMLCDLPMFSLKFKNFALETNALRYVFLLLAVLIIVFMGIYAAPAIIISLYIGISAVQAIARKKA